MNAYRFEEIENGLTERFTVTITDQMMDVFRNLTGDRNPLHKEASYAGGKGYRDKVCFGMLTASFLSTMAGVYLPGKYALLQSAEVKFIQPVFPGETICFTGKVTEKNDRFRFIKVKVEGVNASGVKKLKASMQIGVTE